MLQTSRVDPNQADNYDTTPLYAAIGRDHASIAPLLCDKKADIHQPRKDGCIPIQVTAFQGHRKIAKFLLDNKADLHVGDKLDSDNALHWACKNKEARQELIDLLLEQKADVSAQCQG